MGSLSRRKQERAVAQRESGGTNVGDPTPHGGDNRRDMVPRKTKKESMGFFYHKRRMDSV